MEDKLKAFNNGMGHVQAQKKLPHESFQEYAIHWRLEASKIYPSLSEEELISTFIHVKEGLYYEKLLGTCAHSFSDLIKVGKKIQNGFQGGRILSNSPAKVVQQTFQPKIPVNLQSKMRENNSIFMTMQQPQHYPSDQFLQSHATSNYCNVHLQHPSKQQLHQAQPSFKYEHTPKHFDSSKNCAYHSNIQGHDTENCPSLKFKIQSMIESGKIKLQIDPLTSYDNITNTSTIVVKGTPLKLAPRHLKSKRATSQED
ncbi:hypothetical protein H5410_051147 [Solanum commersonii]|uniref:Retrotransposon gag domain-containing protein n=1 Tax=Solanum commersonii TaxID=4109 RepID=A0A9J5X030_SOLCO|nr:hypothetical protein H5410_051147 [Solanum commersonii]